MDDMSMNAMVGNKSGNKGFKPLVSEGSEISEASDVLENITDSEEIYHITWVTHNSRISERMRLYKVKIGEPIIFSDEDKKVVTEIIKKVINEYSIKFINYIVNSDHVHIIIICKDEERDNIVKILKSKTTYYYKKIFGIVEKFNLWAQKYNSSIIKSDEELVKVINYVKYNDLKH